MNHYERAAHARAFGASLLPRVNSSCLGMALRRGRRLYLLFFLRSR